MMVRECGHTWLAQLLHANTNKVTSVRQVCVLPKGHKGDHRSLTKVKARNKEG